MSPTILGVQRGVAQLAARGVWDAEVGGSNPLTPTPFYSMLYVFFGEDDYTVRARARAVEARYADPAGAPSVLRLDGATTPWDDVVSACRVLPFLSSHQVVRLNGLIGAWGQRRARNSDEPATSRRRSTSAEDPTRPGASPATLAAPAATPPETTGLV